MSGQSGEYLTRLDSQSIADLHEDDIEHGYQLAVKWRYRIRNRTQRLADADKEIIMQHVDSLIAACNMWRGRYLAGNPKE